LIDAGYEGAFELDLWSDSTVRPNYDDLLAGCRSRFEALGLVAEPLT
jgi:hypothetical protein